MRERAYGVYPPLLCVASAYFPLSLQINFVNNFIFPIPAQYGPCNGQNKLSVHGTPFVKRIFLYTWTVKGKCHLARGHDVQRGEQMNSSTPFIDLDPKREWVVNTTTLSLYPQRETLYSVYWKLGRPQGSLEEYGN